MKRGIFAAVVATLALAGAGTTAAASAEIRAQVDSVATVTNATITHFQFDLYNCPAGDEILIAEWSARQPSREDSFAFSGLQPYGTSNGDAVQHLVLITGSASFLPGELWTGSGTILCGAVAVPVAGSGQTKAFNGI